MKFFLDSAHVDQIKEARERIDAELSKVIIGQRDVIEHLAEPGVACRELLEHLGWRYSASKTHAAPLLFFTGGIDAPPPATPVIRSPPLLKKVSPSSKTRLTT